MPVWVITASTNNTHNYERILEMTPMVSAQNGSESSELKTISKTSFFYL